MNLDDVKTTVTKQNLVPQGTFLNRKESRPVPVGSYLLFLGLAGVAIVGTTILTRKNPGFKGKALNRTLGFVLPFVLRHVRKSLVGKWSAQTTNG